MISVPMRKWEIELFFEFPQLHSPIALGEFLQTFLFWNSWHRIPIFISVSVSTLLALTNDEELMYSSGCFDS